MIMIKITKSSFALIISMLFMIAVTSCEKEEAAVGQDDLSAVTDQEFSDLLIRVTGETSGGGTTKTTLDDMETHWIADTDKVGIYSPQARPTSGGDPGVENSEFTAETTGKSSDFEGEMYWGSGDHDFYFYYPWASGTPDATDVPITLPTAQTQSAAGNSAHIGVLDFMVATPLTGVSPGGAGDETSGVNFQYNHVFTLLEFQVTGTGTLSKVKLAGPGTLAFGSGTIDITQGTPDAGVAYTIAGSPDEYDEVTVELVTPVELGVDAVSVYMMINPGDHSGDMAIGLEIGGEYTYMAKSPPEGGFERGKKYEVPVNSVDFANEVIFTYRSVEVTYGIVLGAKGRLWMDRNLGASQVATSSTDADAYGDLFQWGRLDDGHQARNSGTTPTLSTGDNPGHGDFILAPDDPWDWRSSKNDNLWQGDGGSNDVCPAGWRVPTETEFNDERLSWSLNYSDGAFASPLKLPVAGGRFGSSGSLYGVGSDGRYWSSTVDGAYSRYLVFGSSAAYLSSNYRASGSSVRCLKDDTSD